MLKLSKDQGIKLFDVKLETNTAGPSPFDNYRTEIFLLGCVKACQGDGCPGCFNSSTWYAEKAEWSYDPVVLAAYLNEITPNSKIIIHGLSMGGGIALDLTDKDMKNVKAIISDAPSESIRGFFMGMAAHIFKKDADKVASHAIARFEKEFGVDINDFERLDVVANSQYPLLLSAGSAEDCEELFETIKSKNPKPTEIIILPGCNHGNGMYKQTELYQRAIKEFIHNSI